MEFTVKRVPSYDFVIWDITADQPFILTIDGRELCSIAHHVQVRVDVRAVVVLYINRLAIPLNVSAK